MRTSLSALAFPRAFSQAGTLRMSSVSSSRVAVCQVCSNENREQNFATVQRLATAAKAQGSVLACFPENFDFLGTSSQQSIAIAEPMAGSTLARYRKLAADLQLWLSLGGYQEQAAEQAAQKTHIRNAHVLIDSAGEVVSTYRKVHLFDAPYVNLKESAFTQPGSELVVANSPVGMLGMTVCYDLRFPELYTALRQRGAQVLLIPAAFTVPTGTAHWEVLLRARAIETQCYVLAAAQSGQHNEKCASYGHSLIIDPWGKILAQCESGEGVIYADIDLAFLQEVRARMPVLDHRRPDVYSAL